MKLRKTARVIGCKETYSKTENNCRITICLLKTDSDKPWYFVVDHKTLILTYNSNLDQIMFSTKEECLIAAENKLKEFIESDFSIDFDNVHIIYHKN